MKKIYLLLALICCVAVRSLSAEPPPKPPENRFLFVIETSLPMNRSAKAAQETVHRLIESGVQGQMNPGDTFGLWTFNEQLNTTFPMQRWLPDHNAKLAQLASDFLKKRRFEKKGQSSGILPPLDSVVKASKAITVILISTGNEPIQGTPFDKEINAIYPLYTQELRDAKLAFVTILVGRDGKLVAYSVNSSLGPIQIPPPPIEPEKIATLVTTNAVAALNKAPAGTTNQVAPRKTPPANIIITKPQTNQPVEKVEVKTEPKAIEAASVKTEPSVAVLEKSEPLKSSTTVVDTIPIAKIETPQKIEAPIVARPLPETTSINSTPNGKTENSKSAPIVSPAVALKDPPTFKPEPTDNTASTESDELTATQETTPVIASQLFYTQQKLLFIGVALVLLAIILVFLLMRHSRNKSQPSLISRSIDQNK